MSLVLNPVFDPVLLSRIEDAGLNASAPPQQRWVDGWLLRFCPGKAKRARCINAVALGRWSLAERLAACEPVFTEAGLPLLMRITPFTQPGEFDAQLEDQGFERFDDTSVMARQNLQSITAPAKATTGMTLRALALQPFAERVGIMRGSSLAQRQAHAVRLLNAPVPYFAFELRFDGEAVAWGQIALEGDIAGLYDIFTAPTARRRGFARILCQHLVAEACSRGARHAYLQVDNSNLPARAVYQGLGFMEAYSYHYRARDPGSE
ncbi:MAG TPA: GNAT family N-acetyltransferase [Burkholderiaceae bacterium]|nr:GNAT family N-acetyltransferase [Burkholderiaceae bacterium]